MSIFAQYAKQAKAAAAPTPLVVTSETDLVTQATDVTDAASEPEVVVDEPATESLVVVDQFAAARERLNQTHHNLIRGRSQIVVEESAPVEQTVETEQVAQTEQVAEVEQVVEATLTEEAEPVMVDEAPVMEETIVEELVVNQEVVVEEPEVSDEVVETPVDVVPEGEVVEEPALDVTAEEEPITPEVVEEPVVDEDGVMPTDIVEEVEEPIDHDIDDNDAEVKIEMTDEQQVDLDQQEIESLEAEMNLLAQSMFAVETYGINPAAVHIMQVTGLLDGTAIQSLGLEAFGYEAPDHPESQMAIEALSGKIKEKAAQWSAKVVSLASSFGTKVMGVLNPLWEKITSSVATLGSASWDKAKEAGKVVRAHPYKTIIGVILAIAAVAGVVVYGASALPAITAKQAQVTKFVSDLASKINKIKWPFGDVKAVVAEGGAKFAVTVKDAGSAAKAVALDKLDWTGTMVKSAGSQLGRAWTVTKQGVTAFGTRAGKVGTSIAGSTFSGYMKGIDASMDIATTLTKPIVGSGKVGYVSSIVVGGMIFNAIISTVVNMTKLVYQIIAGGLRIIASTFGALIGGTRTAAA